jgi:PAS domain S-box-containing protein
MIPDMRKRISRLILKEEIRGERFIYYIRWGLILLEAVSIAVMISNRMFLPASLHAVYFVLAAALYNLFLLFIFKTNRYRGFIKYMSVFIDTAIVALALYISSITTSTFAPIMGSLTFMFLIVMVGSTLRLRKVHALYTTLLIILSFNAVYFLRYPAIVGIPAYAQISAAARIEQLFKTFYIVILGCILYYIIVTLQRLIENVVTAMDRAKQREERVQRQYEEIINGIGDGIVVTNARREIILTNPAFDRLAGMEREELAGRDIWTFFPEGEVRKQQDRTRRLFREEGEGGEFTVTAFESRMKNGTGEEIPVEISVSASANVISGENVYLATVRDIRKRKELEHRLIQSHKIETIGKLACGFAHDFNNLITVMSENIYLAQDEHDPEAIRECLCNNRNVVDKAKDLIEQILVFSTGGAVVEEETSIPVILDKVEKLLINAIPSHVELQFKNTVSAELAFRAHETSIVQILFNLIINARDAIDKSQGIIEVSARLDGVRDPGHPILRPRTDMHGRFLVFSVRDNGMGISRDMLPRVFEPCFTTKVSGTVIGNGLGLAIIYSIVEHLGGGIFVDTAPGQGTAFTIHLPYAEKRGKPAGSSGERDLDILFVDDDEDIRHIGRRILEKRGYRVTLADSGEKALEELRLGGDPDLLIVDFHMPGLEGESLIERLSEKSEAPILLLTGEISEELERVSENRKIVEVMRKPLDIDRFLDTVELATEG